MVRLPLVRCYKLRRVHLLPLLKEGYALADWLNNLSHICRIHDSEGQAAAH